VKESASVLPYGDSNTNEGQRRDDCPRNVG
jgi:hypothetical protein